MDNWASNEFSYRIKPSSVAHSSWNALFESIGGIDYWGGSKGQSDVLANGAAALLLIEKFHRDEGETVDNVDHLLGLTSWMQEFTTCVERHIRLPRGLYPLLLNKAERLATIDNYYERLTTIVTNFQLPASGRAKNTLLSLKDSFDTARKSDQDRLKQRLEKLENDHGSMIEELGFNRSNALSVMARLQRYINDKRGGEQEIHFINSAIAHLSTMEDRVPDLKPWTIPAVDVDIGRLIGDGSLGKVFRGRWDEKDVVIKMLKTSNSIIPRLAYVNREMEIWSKLHHPNVLPFLGGNNVDDGPFIIIPFLKHQTCRDYIQQHPNCNRLELLHKASLGLLYLHSERVIHGNLKGLNILIDDDEQPRLCDYGLAKIKADMNSRSPLDPILLGSQNWMAPELFTGSNLTFQSDVYSFGMTMYEVFADDIPLGHVHPNRLYKLVVESNVRPARPEAHQVTDFSDAAWALAEQCWAKHPPLRIELSTLSEQLAALILLPAGDRLLNHPPSKKPPATVVPSTRTLTRASQHTGQWEMI